MPPMAEGLPQSLLMLDALSGRHTQYAWKGKTLKGKEPQKTHSWSHDLHGSWCCMGITDHWIVRRQKTFSKRS